MSSECIGESRLNFRQLFGESLVDFHQYWRKLNGFSPIGIEQYEGGTYARTMPSIIRMYPDVYTYECI